MPTDFQPFDHFHTWVEKSQTIGTDGRGNVATYIPLGALKGYWEENPISLILNASSHTVPIPVPINDILARYVRVFSILAYISTIESSKLRYIQKFVEEAIDDSHLPFKTKPRALSNAADGLQTFDLIRKNQWLFAPVILGNPRLQCRDLPLESVLPFTVERLISGSNGESTTVKKCKVDPSSGLSIDAIVLKEFDSSEVEYSFKNEVDSYISLENNVPPHIYKRQFLEYYGSFKTGDKAYIMLEHADQGSLLDFFERNELPLERRELRGLWSSLINLVIGLEYIHSLEQDPRNSIYGNVRCVHHDLKPANLFVFRRGSSTDYRYDFKIGDFGMSSVALIKARNKSIRAPAEPSTKMYGAPELSSRYADMEHIDYGALWEMDIWSFGCVLFECLVWMTCGSRGLLAFFRMRQKETDGDVRHKDQGYSGCFHNGDTRIQAVDEMMNLVLERRRIFDDLSRPIGDLILREMLIPSNEHRLEAKHLLPRFEKILEAGTRLTQQPKLPQEDAGDSAAPASGPAAVSDRKNIPDRTSKYHDQPRELISYRTSVYDCQSGGDPLPCYDHMNGKYSTHASPNLVSQGRDTGGFALVKIPEVLRWKDDKKKNGAPKALPDHDRAMREIKDREQIFVIDDSSSMRTQHWDQVVDAVNALGYLVKSADPDGVELFLTSRPTKVKTGATEKIGSLVRFLQEHHRQAPHNGKCNMENSLSPILHHVKRGLKDSKLPKFLQRNRRGTNVYILTDAIWEGGTGVQCGVEEPIKDLVRTMQAQGKTRTTVALQFIQFGDDPLGEQRLQYLDDTLGKELKFDIVDHRHHQRDGVWHMLLGSISRGIDEENNIEAEAAAT